MEDGRRGEEEEEGRKGGDSGGEGEIAQQVKCLSAATAPKSDLQHPISSPSTARRDS